MAGVKGRSGRPRKYAARIVTPGDQTPLDFLLTVMRHPDVDPKLRLRAGIAAAPYLHERKTVDTVPGKKDTRQAAARQASKGRFAPAKAPRLVVDNGKPK